MSSIQEPIGCLVLGAGSWGKLIAGQVREMDDLELVGVCDLSEKNTRSAAEDLQTASYTSMEQALADRRVQAVAIATPNDLHASMALQALSAGRHVLLEKPMALTLADARRIQAEAELRGVVLMLDHIQRFFPPLLEIKRLLDSGALGELAAVSLSRRDLLVRKKAWLQQRRRVGGLLYQSASHEFDFLYWTCGRPVEIYCLAAPTILAREPLDYPDAILSQIRFASGVIAHVWNCMTDPLTGYEGVLTGTQGTARFDLYNGEVQWRLIDGQPERRNWYPTDQWSAPASLARGEMPLGEKVALRKVLQSFCKAIRGGQLAVTPEAGAWTVEMAQAGYLSIAERRPVALPLKPEDHDRLTYLEIA